MSHRDTELTFRKRRIASSGSSNGVMSWHAEQVRELEAEIERLRAVIKLARDQDQGCGGGLRPEQILRSMQVILDSESKEQSE